MSSPIIKPTRSKVIRYLKSYAPFWQKKIGFYANFGHGDIGDDACFIAAKGLLGNDILPLSKRCMAFNPHMLRGLLIGGGAALRWDSPYIPRRIFRKDKWGFPVILFSAGINQDYNKEFTVDASDKIKRLCGICDYLTVKDKLSQTFIKNLGFSKVSILPDLGLALEEKRKSFNFKKERFTVGIVLTPHSEFTPEDFKKLINALREFNDYLTDSNRDAVYLRFEGRDSEDTKESQLIHEITKQAKGRSNIHILEEDADPGEMLYFVRNYCDAMVCTRLHSAVFSVNAGLPFLSVSYNFMHDGFLGMLEAGDLCIPMFDRFSFPALKDKFEYLAENYDSIKSRLAEKKGYLGNMIEKEILYIKKNFIPNN